jgi:hypothetical protein
LLKFVKIHKTLTLFLLTIVSFSNVTGEMVGANFYQCLPQ